MVKIKVSAKNGVSDLKIDLANFRYDVDEKFNNLEQKINYLPTKEEFYSKMDEVVGELQIGITTSTVF